MAHISSFLKFSPNELVLDDWEILDDPGSIHLSDILAIMVGCVFFLVPGLLTLWEVITRPQRKGYLCLTNWRMVYYEHGEGLFKSHHRVISVNLEDVYGVHCDFVRTWLGKTSLYLRIHTRSEDGFSIKIGDRGKFLARLPLIGRLLEHRSIGKDALWVPAALYQQVQERRAALIDSSSRF